MGVDKFLKVVGGGVMFCVRCFLLEITCIAHFSHANQSFDNEVNKNCMGGGFSTP